MMRLCMDLLLRVLVAVLGGYALVNLGAVAFATLLPLTRVDAALISIQISFALYACAVVWVFSARSAWRAIAGLLVVATACMPVVLFQIDGLSG
ncbi:DUF3649 domain-containing protein [Halopseudomonas pelagia]|uniref:DUF3649 domain-containing protein n=1 Tax=Halopseudomonas pelagia TaxID=553151 RepID=UPI0003A5239F|nr:DUF3649 domain-containing protein [Halopseudomonas pelagia]|tara:strand:- start:1558 stop:1839 length:282 start_codon:yes stop_codon:yes gene_type:complete